MQKVLCAGMIVCDIPLRPIPASIMTDNLCLIEAPRPCAGGNALNVAITLNKLGITPLLSGMIGHDSNGDFIMEETHKLGLDERGLRYHPSLGTMVCYILVEANGARHFCTYNELSKVFSYTDIIPTLIEEADLVYYGCALCMEAMDAGGAAALFKKAHDLGKLTLADTCNALGEHPSAFFQELLSPMLHETDIFAPSYDEAIIISGAQDLSAIRHAFSGYGIKILTVKLGKHGSYITDFHDEWLIPAFTEFVAKDTTGAGDAFTAGFIRGLLAGWNPPNAARFANAVAGFKITQVGPTGGVPDFETLYRYVSER
ncbi:MAG: carbohydrate kinase family protein [Treponema sp.]|jgi:sugar/nucleoside kinase (ribokinase family)|nr:carbohydrate kinase family protein [Treponema sp.]